MTFSVVIPTYNGADFVALAIESVLNQTRPADEVIVSDDNSSDQTLAICQQYGNRIKVFQNPNGPSGFVTGWNNAIAYATSDYISILHQDDLLASTFLMEAERAFNQYPQAKHLFVPCNYIDRDGNIMVKPDYCDNTIRCYKEHEYVKAYCTIGTPHVHRCPGVITHRDIFKVCQYRNCAGHIADNDFFFRVGQYTDVIGILKPLAFYRIHKESETGHLKDRILVRRLYKGYGFLLKDYRKTKDCDDFLIKYIKDNKNEYLKHLLGYGLKHGYFSDILYALRFLL